MRYAVAAGVAAFMLAPALAAASSIDAPAWTSEFSQRVIGIVNSVVASSSTGGIHVYSSSAATGSSNSSVQITNIVRDTNGSGVVDTEVRTDTNGTVRMQSVHRTFSNDENVNVTVATSSSLSGAQSSIRLVVKSGTDTGTSTSPMSSSTPVLGTWLRSFLPAQALVATGTPASSTAPFRNTGGFLGSFLADLLSALRFW